MRRLWLLGLTALSMALLFAGAYWVGYRVTLAQIAERGEAALVLVSERLTLELDRHRYLPAVLANDPTVRDILSDPDTIPIANQLLQRVADTSGALDIYVMDRGGTTVASSNWNLERSFIGSNYAWRPYFERAIRGGLGYYHAVGNVSRQRGFYFAHPILGDDRSIAGVIAVKVDLEGIETQWRGDQQNLFFSDQNGVIFLSNRLSLVLRKFGDAPIPDLRQYAGREILPLPDISRSNLGRFELWSDIALNDFPHSALFLTSPVPTLGLDANILVDVQQARTQAFLWGGLAGLLGGLLWLSVAIVMQRRAAFSNQLRIEEEARNQLEYKVVERTAKLGQVQAQLVQAGKLSALGEMSAGISHELNQPLTAIQSLAENADILLERGKLDDVQSNVTKISQMAARMGRIIRNLRSFARNEAEEIADVELIGVLHDALGIVKGKVDGAGASIKMRDDLGEVYVRGGRVRLSQVLVNLISNAVDAMEGLTLKEVEINVLELQGKVQVTVRDNGPGLADPERIFDPFFTTKTVGEGLGLGLSISYGIVQSFGGQIDGANHPDGGAVFTIELTKAKARERTL